MAGTGLFFLFKFHLVCILLLKLITFDVVEKKFLDECITVVAILRIFNIEIIIDQVF
jgi:hypothetical protein